MERTMMRTFQRCLKRFNLVRVSYLPKHGRNGPLFLAVLNRCVIR